MRRIAIKDLKQSDFFHGQKFEALFEDDGSTILLHGRITIENSKIFLCQNHVDGFSCKDKQGFRYSYKLMRSSGTIVPNVKINSIKLEQKTSTHDLVVEGLSDENEDWLLSNYTQELSFLRINERPQHPQRQLVFRFKVEASNESREHIRNQIKLKGGNSKETLSSIDTN